METKIRIQPDIDLHIRIHTQENQVPDLKLKNPDSRPPSIKQITFLEKVDPPSTKQFDIRIQADPDPKLKKSNASAYLHRNIYSFYNYNKNNSK